MKAFLAGLLAGLIALPAAAQQTIRIGAIQPLSGPLAPYAQETQPVLDYLVKKINAEGGIRSMGGARLELLVGDSASQPGRAATEARRLITQEKVALLTGSLLTNEMLAVAGVIDEYRTPTLSLLAGGSKSEHLFSIGLPYDQGYARGMVDFVGYLKEQPGFRIRTVATAYSNYEGGQQINRHAVERLKALGLEVVGDFPLDMKAADLLPSLLKIRGARPDMVVGLELNAEIVKMQQARFQLKAYDFAFIGNTSFADPTLKRDLGEIGREVLPKGMFGLALFARDARIDAARAVADDVERNATLAKGFGQFAVAAAQGVRVIQAALEAAGSTEPAALRQALAGVEIPAGSPHLYLPLSKGLSFNEDRVIRHMETLVVQWSDALEPVVVWPEAFATSKPRPWR